MFPQFVDQILSETEAAEQAYYRLVLVVGSAGAGKTTVLKKVHQKIGAPMVNLNLILSKKLLEINISFSPARLPALMEDLINNQNADIMLLDNIELLFEPSLKQDPLRLLQRLSRNQTIVAAWNGKVENNILIYGTPDHPEYRYYSIEDLILMQLPDRQ